MRVDILYNYSTNEINFTRKDGLKYSLKLNGRVVVVDGDSGTGKTLLVNELSSLKNSNSNLTGVDLSNIIILHSKDDKIKDDEVLYILDRGDMILDDYVCDKICDCSKARFLIFARGNYNLGISPNHFGRFERTDNTISLVYDFNEKWW